MIFDLLFITISIFSTIGLYFIIRWSLKKNQQKAKERIKQLFAATGCSIFIIWNLLLLLVPAGNQLHEIIRLPRHFWMINNTLELVEHDRIVYGKHANQYCHIMHPSLDSSPKNTVIFFVHGGGWSVGGPYQHHYLAKIFSDLGYTVVLPAYRLAPTFSYEHLNDDLDQSLQVSLNYIDSIRSQPQHLIIGGVSAGANLATLLAFDEQRWQSTKHSRNRLKGVFSLAGALNLDKMPFSVALKEYAGKKDGTTFQKANPINYINKSDTFELLCIHGNKDGLCSLGNAKSFHEKMKNIHPNLSRLHILDKATHLDLGAGWYYHSPSERGQKKVLIEWIQKL
jgi:acetyl esterase/lipase